MSDARLFDADAGDSIALVERRDDESHGRLFPAELALIGSAVPARQREFTTGRLCAHQAVAALGHPPQPILRGHTGAPIWPPGIMGSITHCTGYRAAAAARAADVVTLGIDAEPALPVPDGVLVKITGVDERERVIGLSEQRPSVQWGRIVFSAKEAVYKAWFPIMQTSLGFEDVDVDLVPDGVFVAHLRKESARIPAQLRGRWSIDDGVVRTAVAVVA